MLSPVSIEDTMGYRIEVGTDILPTDIRSAVNDINVWLEQCKDLKIVSKNDYIVMCDRLKIVKGFNDDIDNYKRIMLKPVDSLKDKINGALNPIKQNCGHTESCMKEMMIDWNTKIKRKRDDERADKLREAREEEIVIKKELEAKAIKERRNADILEARKNIEIEKRKELDTKKIEAERNALQITEQIEEAKKEIVKDSSNAEEIGKEIGTLEKLKCTIEHTIKNIETDVSNVNNQIKLISVEEFDIMEKVQKLTVEKDTLIIAPDRLLTEKVPKISGIVYAKLLKYRTIDINMVPKEWTNVVITVNDKKVREALKLKGKNLNIPGIEVYEEDNLRSPSY